MTRKLQNYYSSWAKSLSNDRLEDEYYKFVLCSLGSVAEEMYERGYDIADIKEQESLERDYSIISCILERECSNRGISLWQ